MCLLAFLRFMMLRILPVSQAVFQEILFRIWPEVTRNTLQKIFCHIFHNWRTAPSMAGQYTGDHLVQNQIWQRNDCFYRSTHSPLAENMLDFAHVEPKWHERSDIETHHRAWLVLEGWSHRGEVGHWGKHPGHQKASPSAYKRLQLPLWLSHPKMQLQKERADMLCWVWMSTLHQHTRQQTKVFGKTGDDSNTVDIMTATVKTAYMATMMTMTVKVKTDGLPNYLVS